jgi:hypothetical protein
MVGIETDIPGAPRTAPDPEIATRVPTRFLAEIIFIPVLFQWNKAWDRGEVRKRAAAFRLSIA